MNVGFFAFDPGTATGAGTLLNGSGIIVWQMSIGDMQEETFARLLLPELGKFHNVFSTVESVGLRPGQGKSSNNKLAMSKAFMYGLLFGVTANVSLVLPTTWQLHHGLGGLDTYGMTPAKAYEFRKKHYCEFANILYDDGPEAIPLDVADSYLMAKWLLDIHLQGKVK